MRLSLFLRQKAFRSVERIIQLACVFGLLGLSLFAVSLLFPQPLLVILSMSLGHALGGFAVALYLLAILFDALKAEENPMDSPKPNESGTRDS